MGLIYLDASVLVALLVEDPHTDRVASWYSGLRATVIISDFANIEVCAVLSRHLRFGRLVSSQAESALLDLDAMRGNCQHLAHSPSDFLTAERVVRDFSTKLAAPDALHLASAKNAGATLATLDLRLAEAARGQGLALVDLR